MVHLRLVGVPEPPPDMSEHPERVGSYVHSVAYCPCCESITQQVRRIIPAVEGVREASTELHCRAHRGWVEA